MAVWHSYCRWLLAYRLEWNAGSYQGLSFVRPGHPFGTITIPFVMAVPLLDNLQLRIDPSGWTFSLRLFFSGCDLCGRTAFSWQTMLAAAFLSMALLRGPLAVVPIVFMKALKLGTSVWFLTTFVAGDQVQAIVRFSWALGLTRDQTVASTSFSVRFAFGGQSVFCMVFPQGARNPKTTLIAYLCDGWAGSSRCGRTLSHRHRLFGQTLY